jgi:arylsulfatase A-like enzyme
MMSPDRETPALRPNILLVHWHDIGAHLRPYGWPSIPSPRIDELAGQGTLFENAFCTAPLCSPARGSLFTGRYPHSNGVIGLAHMGWEYNPDERTLPALLGDEGYHTALYGLQHESRDATSIGFHEVTQIGGPEQYCVPVTDLAVDFIVNRARRRQPFFLTVGYFETHRPYPSGPDRRIGQYEPADPSDVEVPGWLPDNDHTRRDLAALYGSVSLADEQTGRILDALEQAGLSDETWVIFTTDHGLAFPGAKSTLFDPGLEVALIMRLPADWRSPPEVYPHLFSHVDVVPTVLEMLEIDVPDRVQGVSVAPWLRGEEPRPRREVFGEKNYHDVDQYDPVRCIRTETHKYVRSFVQHPRLLMSADIETSLTAHGMDDAQKREPRREEELYDLTVDPFERHNLVDDPGHEEVRRRLADRLEAWRQETRDPLLQGPIPAPAGQVSSRT